MLGTIIQQGNFIGTGAAETIKLRSSVDWMTVYNYTNANAGVVAAAAVKSTWLRGLAANDSLYEGYVGGAWVMGTAAALAVGGFTAVDTSTQVPSAAIIVTGGTNATQPVYSTANTLGMTDGAIVRVSGSIGVVSQVNLEGVDFTVDTVVANTSFRLANTLATAPGQAFGPIAAGVNYRLIARNRAEYDKWYPSVRVISNITQAAAGVVTTLVDHGLTTGQTVRMQVPTICGMTQLDGQLVTVTVLNASTFSINVDTTGYTAFAFPTRAQFLLSPYYATMTPVGIAQAQNTSILSATDNMNFIGLELAAGAQSPAGILNDVIYWVAGKSFNK